jgi:hypothetical protein
MMELAAIPILAALDRLRGSDVGIGKTPEALLYGLTTALLLFGIEPWQPGIVAAFLVLFWAGSAPGWGQPIGWLIDGRKSGEYEFWQKGPLQNYVHLAVIVRGLIWALPVAPLYYLDHRVIAFLIAMPLAFYGAALIAKALLKWTIHAWEAHEWIRGALLGLIIILTRLL